MLKASFLQSHEKAAFRDGRQKVLPQGQNKEPTFEVHKHWEKTLEQPKNIGKKQTILNKTENNKTLEKKPGVLGM